MSHLDNGIEEWLLSRCEKALLAEANASSRPGAADPLLRMQLDNRPSVDVEGWHWSFIYKDDHDDRRSVRLTRIVAVEAGFLFRGYDLGRAAPRDFSAGAMRDCHDAVTGEVVESPHAIAEQMMVSARRSALARALPLVRDGCYVLCAIAAVDGAVYDDEVEAILTFVDKVSGDHGILLSNEDFLALRPLVARFRPTPRTVISALTRCAHQDGVGPVLLRSIRDLCHRDDHLSTAEERVVQMFATALAFYRQTGSPPRSEDWDRIRGRDT